jgi:hypothetical protein
MYNSNLCLGYKKVSFEATIRAQVFLYGIALMSHLIFKFKHYFIGICRNRRPFCQFFGKS